MHRKITPSQISPQWGQGNEIWMIDRETFSTPLLMFPLMCQCNPLIKMVWYPEHQVKGWTSETQKSIRGNQGVDPTKSLWGGGQLPQTRYYNNRSSGWVCWPRHLLYRLSRDQYYNSWKMFQPSYLPEIQIWLVSGYSRLIKSRRKMKVCNTNRRDDVARFSGNELRQQAPKHELVLLRTCEHTIRDKHDHMVVLQ